MLLSEAERFQIVVEGFKRERDPKFSPVLDALWHFREKLSYDVQYETLTVHCRVSSVRPRLVLSYLQLQDCFCTWRIKLIPIRALRTG